MHIPNFSLPEKPWAIWLVSTLLPVTYVITASSYFWFLGKSGTLDPNADSIGIPIFGSWLFAIPLTVVIFLITSLAMISYVGERGTMLAWNSSKPAISWMITLLFGGPALLLVLSTFYSVFQIYPWYEYIWELNVPLWVLWLLYLRAAIVSRTIAQPQ